VNAEQADPAPRLRIGLTGGIASGKSTVAGVFKRLGVPVIDADEVARRLVEPGTAGLAAVAGRFGEDLLGPDGKLDRAALRARIFADPAARRDLEAILHPLIRATMDAEAAGTPGPYVVLDIPLLIESGGIDRVDRVLVVDVDEATQVGRVMHRDGVTDVQARAILAAQATREQRLRAADDVVHNEDSLAALKQAVESLHQRYLALAGSRVRPMAG